MRICSRCEIGKHDAEFYTEPRVRNGLSAICKTCNKARRRNRHTKGKGGYATPEQARARGRVRDAVRYGKLVKPDHCQECGAKTPARLLDGHHEDYSKPLEVIWLCRSCHGPKSSDGGVESRHASRSITPLTRGAEKSFGLETLDAKGTAGVAPCPSEAIPLPGSFPFTKAVQG